MNFLAGATSLDSFLKAYKTKETRVSFPTNGSIVQRSWTTKSFLCITLFFSILRNGNPVEKDYNYFQNLVNSGLTTEQSLAKLRMDRIPPTGAEN